MTLLPLSSLFGSSQDLSPVYFQSVSFTYTRLGSGDTISLWKINGQYYYEDHKAGRPDFDKNYKQFIPGMVDILEGASDITVSEATFFFHSDDNPGHTLSSVLRGVAAAEHLPRPVYAIVPSYILEIGEIIRFVLYNMRGIKQVMPVSPACKISVEDAYVYNGSWLFTYKLNRDISFTPASASPLILDNIIQEEIISSPEVRSLLSLCQYALPKNLIEVLPKRVCLMKAETSVSSSGLSRGFGLEYFTLMHQYGFEIVSPDTHSLTEIYSLLSSAFEIVTSWGAISFINRLFFAERSRILWLCHEGYSSEYDSTPWQLKNCYSCPASSITYIFNAGTCLDSETRTCIEGWLEDGPV